MLAAFPDLRQAIAEQKRERAGADKTPDSLAVEDQGMAHKGKGPRRRRDPLSRSWTASVDCVRRLGRVLDQKPMPPMSGAPPGMAGSFFSGFSATMASVVISRPATEAASCRAVRTTLVGSMMPAFTMSVYFSF